MGTGARRQRRRELPGFGSGRRAAHAQLVRARHLLWGIRPPGHPGCIRREPEPGRAGEYRYQDPAAQPGGDRIVFHSLEKDHWEIFTANTNGSNVTALTRPATTLYTPLPAQRPRRSGARWAAHRFSEQSDRPVEVLGDEPGWQRPAPTVHRRAHRVQLSSRTGCELGKVGAETGEGNLVDWGIGEASSMGPRPQMKALLRPL